MREDGLLKWFWRALGWTIPAVIALLLTGILPLVPEFTETVFSRGISHFLTTTVGKLVSLVPFSLTEAAIFVLIGGLALVFILVVFKTVWRALRHEEQPESHPLRILRIFGWIVSFAVLLHLCAAGANYHRLPAEELCGLTVRSTPLNDELFDLCVELADRASAEREALETDEKGRALLLADVGETLDRAGEGYAPLAEEFPFLEHNVTRVKPVTHLSHKWSQMAGMSGVYFSLFMEPNINVDLPEIELPFAAEHEMAHLRGIAKEDEANFFGAMACFRHPSADYRYSGYLQAYLYCSNALYDADIQLWAKAEKHCSKGVLRDLKAQNEYWDSIDGGTVDIPGGQPLRYQTVEQSSASYNRVVQLLCAYYDGGNRSLSGES